MCTGYLEGIPLIEGVIRVRAVGKYGQLIAVVYQRTALDSKQAPGGYD